MGRRRLLTAGAPANACLSQRYRGNYRAVVMKQTRRKVINILLGSGLLGWLASLFYPVFSFLKPPAVRGPNVQSVKAGLTDDFRPNSGRIIRFGRRPVILIRTGDGEFRAFSAVCTHLSCIVQYRDDFQHIWCACHNGHYDLRGRNIAGPPPRPLDIRYDVSVVNNEVIVAKPATSS